MTFISSWIERVSSTARERLSWLMMQLLGAMALIQERVKAGLRNARAKGKRLGRPRTFVSESKVTALRDSGVSWRAIAEKLGVGMGTAYRASQRGRAPCAQGRM